MSIYDTLNEQQKEAVFNTEGAVLVLAGAGSGKTRALTHRIAYLVDELGVSPFNIMAITFTNKAAGEMKERVASMIGEELADNTVIRTFHSFGVWILRKYGDKIGINDNFTIYDDKESAALLQQCFPDAQKKDIDSAAKKISMYKEVVLYGGMTINEWRRACNMAPLTDGDTTIMRLDATKANDKTNEPEEDEVTEDET